MSEHKTTQQELNCKKLFKKFAQNYEGTDFDEIIEALEDSPELLEDYCEYFKDLFQKASDGDYDELRKEFIDIVSEIIEDKFIVSKIIEDKFRFDSIEVYNILKDKDLNEITELAADIINEEIDEIDLVKKLYAMEDGLEYWEDIEVYENWEDLIEDVLDMLECPEKCRYYIDEERLKEDLEIDGYTEFLGYVVRRY